MSINNPVLGDRLRVRIVCANANQIAENILFYRCSLTTLSSVTLVEVAEAIDILVEAEYKAIMSTDAIYRGVGVQSYFPLPLSNEAHTAANAGPGTNASISLPLQVAPVLRKTTNYGGPSGRGRIYTPFPPGAAVTTDGAMSPTYLTALENLAAVYPLTLFVVGAGGTARFEMGLQSRTNPTAFPEILDIIAVGLFGTQRRRGQYGRGNLVPF